MKARAILAVAMVLLVAVPAAQAAPATDSDWKRQGVEAPRAKAACPICIPVAIVAIRTAAVRAAPVAIRAVGAIGRGTVRTRARIKAGAGKSRSWARRVKGTTVAKATVLFHKLPKYAKGCGRGFVDHIRDYGDISLLRAFYACGRGIVEIYLGKNPLGPIDK